METKKFALERLQNNGWTNAELKYRRSDVGGECSMGYGKHVQNFTDPDWDMLYNPEMYIQKQTVHERLERERVISEETARQLYYQKVREMEGKPLEAEFTEKAIDASLKRWKNKNLEMEQEFEADVRNQITIMNFAVQQKISNNAIADVLEEVNAMIDDVDQLKGK